MSKIKWRYPCDNTEPHPAHVFKVYESLAGSGVPRSEWQGVQCVGVEGTSDA